MRMQVCRACLPALLARKLLRTCADDGQVKELWGDDSDAITTAEGAARHKGYAHPHWEKHAQRRFARFRGHGRRRASHELTATRIITVFRARNRVAEWTNRALSTKSPSLARRAQPAPRRQNI